MDELTLAKATEPFFTTKGPGKGTGLGLSMVQGLAAQSNGLLRLASHPGKGTTVDLWLPRADLDASARLDAHEPAEAVGRAEAASGVLPWRDPARRRRCSGQHWDGCDAGRPGAYRRRSNFGDAGSCCLTIGNADRSCHYRPRDAGNVSNETAPTTEGEPSRPAGDSGDRIRRASSRHRKQPGTAKAFQAILPA